MRPALRFRAIAIAAAALAALGLAGCSSGPQDAPRPTASASSSAAAASPSPTPTPHARDPVRHRTDDDRRVGRFPVTRVRRLRPLRRLHRRVLDHRHEHDGRQHRDPHPAADRRAGEGLQRRPNPGVGVEDLPRQVDLAIAQQPDLVTVLIGGNDICRATVADMTSASSYGGIVESAAHPAVGRAARCADPRRVRPRRDGPAARRRREPDGALPLDDPRRLHDGARRPDSRTP